MITELTARNFKSWKDTGRLRFAPLTGFFGANSSGKTSILQTLLLLKQTVERPPDWNEPLYFGDEQSLVNLGSLEDIIHYPVNDSRLEISVSWKTREEIDIRGNLTNFLSFLTSIVKNKYGDTELEGFRYTFGEYNVGIGWTPQGYKFINNNISADAFRCYGLVSPSNYGEDYLSLQNAFENLFSQILYLGPLREYPRRRYPWEGDHPTGVGQYGEKMIPATLSSRIRGLPTDEQIPKWLQQLGLIDSYDVRPLSDTGGDYECLVKQYKGGPEVPLTDVGFGVSQVLPVLILCYYAPEGSILILEQPEAHLHPKVQSELADVLIDVVKNRNIQIILESHSAHLLHRLQRRIAEEDISADQTAFYFCQINDGTSEIERLDVDEYGNIRNWPQNFFGDDLGDLVEKTKAEMQRRKVIE